MSGSDTDRLAAVSKKDPASSLDDKKLISSENTTAQQDIVSHPKKKVSKPSVLPTFLPPCRVCNAKASGFHYGMH